MPPSIAKPDGLSALAAPWLAAGVLAVLISAQAGLLDLGRWQGDEYIQAASARQFGLHYLISRLSGFSPRPVSELLLLSYYAVVSAFDRPFIRPFLVLHWAVFAASGFVTMRWHPAPARSWRIMLGLAILAMCLSGNDLSELFFWPAAVAAYLTTLAAIILCLMGMLDGRDRSPGGLAFTAASLSVAAMSSESGAMFVGAYAALRLIALLRPGAPRGVRTVMCWAVPLVIAAVVLAVIGTSARIGGAESSGLATQTLHHLGASLSGAAQQLGLEFVSLDSASLAQQPAAAGIGMKLLFFCGVRAAWRRAFPALAQRAGLLTFAVALLLGALATIVAANYQYGGVCCSRHGALRQCWFDLAIAVLAIWSARGPSSRMPAWAGPLLLLLAAGLPFAVRLPRLANDYRLLPKAIETRSETWRSGLAANTGMVFVAPPEGLVVHGAALPVGRFQANGDAPWWATGLMLFFHKQEVEIRGPAG